MELDEILEEIETKGYEGKARSKVEEVLQELEQRIPNFKVNFSPYLGDCLGFFIPYKNEAFVDSALDEEAKAEVLLHEGIHAHERDELATRAKTQSEAARFGIFARFQVFPWGYFEEKKEYD
jgi:hypothetical protein